MVVHFLLIKSELIDFFSTPRLFFPYFLDVFLICYCNESSFFWWNLKKFESLENCCKHVNITKNMEQWSDLYKTIVYVLLIVITRQHNKNLFMCIAVPTLLAGDNCCLFNRAPKSRILHIRIVH